MYHLEPFAVAQFFAVFGYCMYVVSSLMKSRVKLLALEALGCFAIALHWFLLEMPVIGMMNLVYVYMSVVGMLIAQFPWARQALALSFPLLLAATILNFDGASTQGLVAVAATLIGLVATTLGILSKYCVDMIKLRLLSVAGTTLWLACAIISGSIVPIIAMALFGLGHARGLCDLLGREGAIRLSPVVVRSRRS